MFPVCVLRVLVSGPGLALQFALQDLKIVTIWQVLHVHPLFVMYFLVCYKRERECVCVCLTFV